MADDLLIGDIFRTAVRAAPDRVAAWRGDESITFAELDRRGNQVARALAALGVGHTDRVVAWSDTTLDVLPLFVALAKLGAVFAPISPLLAPEEAEVMIAAAKPTAIVRRRCDAPPTVPRSRRASASRSSSSRASACGEDDADVVRAATARDRHARRVLHEREHRAPEGRGDLQPGERPAYASGRAARTEGRDGRAVPALPHGRVDDGAAAVAGARQRWCSRRPTRSTICDAIERHRATRVHCLPGIWRRVLDHLDTPRGPARATCRRVAFADAATSATPIELLTAIDQRAPERHGARVLRLHRSRAGLVAPARRHVPQARERRRARRSSPRRGSIRGGELCVRGPLLFDGYLDDPEATAAALVDGWYHTGDVVDVDDEGYLSIVGRARDVIRTGGETVAPPEVEAVLGEVPGRRRRRGDRAARPAVGRGGLRGDRRRRRAARRPRLDDLRAYCDGRLARFKQPRRVEVVDAIPRTPATQQVQRRLLVDRLS